MGVTLSLLPFLQGSELNRAQALSPNELSENPNIQKRESDVCS